MHSEKCQTMKNGQTYYGRCKELSAIGSPIGQKVRKNIDYLSNTIKLTWT